MAAVNQLSDTCAALAQESSILNILLSRNKSQHRRTGYFRALDGAAAALRRLEPANLPSFFQYVTDAPKNAEGPSSISAGALDAALVSCAETTVNFRRASSALQQQMAAGYFLTLCTTCLAISARAIILVRAIALRLLSLQRTHHLNVDQPSELSSKPILLQSLEWLVSFGDISSLQQPPKSKKRGSSQAARGAPELEEGRDVNSDDVGERVALPITSRATNALPVSLAAPVPSGAALLATDYSDSEASSANEEETGNTALLAHTSETEGWCIDTAESTETSDQIETSSRVACISSAPLSSTTKEVPVKNCEDDVVGEEVKSKSTKNESTSLVLPSESLSQSSSGLLADQYSESEDDESPRLTSNVPKKVQLQQADKAAELSAIKTTKVVKSNDFSQNDARDISKAKSAVKGHENASFLRRVEGSAVKRKISKSGVKEEQQPKKIKKKKLAKSKIARSVSAEGYDPFECDTEMTGTRKQLKKSQSADSVSVAKDTPVGNDIDDIFGGL
eukprot:CAMPEP_0172605632 /NCGR_PEP_ID=MMETSP1068-20121228/25874_1 /TAXON_ID=35684 /ORGANISM="Pseudopedinella elastica, Strain CCMP716" /LENGTH=507 /DNA_ID=CAMNT_0013408091 /DNA_START=306 /DNA_END=1829 /DNA_ORIENTATION=-